MAFDKHPKWLAFDCPCKDRHRVLLNLNPNRQPAWTIHTQAPLTITPSIDETRASGRCHYFLQNGQVVWV
ncbi:hypothetical protein HUT16_37265 [Kitasatospora sp. NA04385]|uniref:DUF6527 family protein n=1 Tax=Kitasatospora sp. NA04385 TaxID=2742135 RepID=UPI0015922FAC|nr:DUF6527 family protein [Kitasatospora sp. NA04385]QKW23983.1 hypothetical protein HUT16_37265 [Kitasatospora sp. NA04385]